MPKNNKTNEELLPKKNNVCGWCKKININGHWVEFKKKDIDNYANNYPKRKSFISQFPTAEAELIWRCNGKCLIKRNQNRKNENSPTSFVFLKNEDNNDVFKRVNNLEKKVEFVNKRTKKLKKQVNSAKNWQKGVEIKVEGIEKNQLEASKKETDLEEKEQQEEQELDKLKQKYFTVDRWERKYKRELTEKEKEHLKKAKNHTELTLLTNDLKYIPVVKETKNLKEESTINIKLFTLETKFHRILWGTALVALIITVLVSWWKWKKIQEWLDKPITEGWEDEEEGL